MPEGLEHAVPAATAPLPAAGSIESQVEEIRGWILGYVKDNKQQPGIMAMMTELYEEAKVRRERREAFGRAVAGGSVLAVFTFGMNWVKDHWK